MLKLVVLDRSAESRHRIVEEINQFLKSDIPDLELMPRIDVKPLTGQELKFHAVPDVCIVGEEIVRDEIIEVGRIRKLLPDTPILVRISHQYSTISTIEQLARFGADDTMSVDTTAAEFLRKIVILSRRKVKTNSGKLIVVDSGKGGLGVTSVAAGLAEALVDHGKKTVLIDLDFETQDLSRFMQARPFINENLQMLLDRSRPVTQEFVEQCLVSVWEDEDKLVCMPPISECEDLYELRTAYSRIFISVLETLDALFDCIVVDIGCARGAMLKTVYRVADKCIFLVNNDPACLYASANSLGRVRSMMAPGAELLVVENNSSKLGLPSKVLRTEFSRAARIENETWLKIPIPHCKAAFRWPGSGASIYAYGGEKIINSLNSMIRLMELVETGVSEQQSKKGRFFWERRSLNRQDSYIEKDPVKEIPAVDERRMIPETTSEKENQAEEKESSELVGLPEAGPGSGLPSLTVLPATRNNGQSGKREIDINQLISGVSLS